MTTSKYEESIKELVSTDDAKRLKALRFIKNSVIGNKTKKDLYIKLGVVERLVEYLSLSDPEAYGLKIQAATILGSIAYGKDENAISVVAFGALNPLLNSLRLPPHNNLTEAIHQRRKLLEASTRALKSIFSSSKVSKEQVFMDGHIEDIVALLEGTSPVILLETQNNVSSDSLSFAMIAEFTAAIVAKCCDTPEQQMELASAGVLKPLINLLYSNCIKAQEAALDALATLCRENTEIGKMVVGGSLTQDKQQSCIETILEFVKEKCPKMRLIAATCLTNLYRTGAFSESTDSIVLVVLPALVKLLSEPTGDVQEKAPLVLADLIKDSEDMQKAAFEAYAIPRLVELLATLSTKDSNSADLMLGVPGVGSLAKRKQKIRENCLIAIAAATLAKEECRTQAIDQKVLPYVVQALQSEYPNVRLAACQCAKSLSRSVSNLRTSLVDAGIAVPLIKLLNDSSIVIQAAACGAICNLVLEFSPMRKSVIDGGGIEHFVEFSRSSDPKLQLNGVWALKSLLFKSDLPVKKAVMKVLTYNALIDLLHQPAPAIQEQALEIVRNLVCGNQEAIEDVIEGIGKDDLLDVIESKLEDTFDMDVDDEDDAAVARTLEPALFIVVNMSSGPEGPKMALMSRPNITNSVFRHLSHDNPAIRAAATWCMINWTWKDREGQQEGLKERVRYLRDLGAEQKLRVMESDSCRDVRDRAMTALEQLMAASS